MSKWKSSVFPGKAFEERSQTRLMSSQERSPCGADGCTRLADRDTTSFRMLSASPQWTVCSRSRSQRSHSAGHKKPPNTGTCLETSNHTCLFYVVLMQFYFWKRSFWHWARSGKLQKNRCSMRISRGLACSRMADGLWFGCVYKFTALTQDGFFFFFSSHDCL